MFLFSPVWFSMAKLQSPRHSSSPLSRECSCLFVTNEAEPYSRKPREPHAQRTPRFPGVLDKAWQSPGKEVLSLVKMGSVTVCCLEKVSETILLLSLCVIIVIWTQITAWSLIWILISGLCNILIFIFQFWTRSFYVVHLGLKLMGSTDSPILASKVSGTLNACHHPRMAFVTLVKYILTCWSQFSFYSD